MRGWSYIIICKIIFLSLFLASCNYSNSKKDPNATGGQNINLSGDTLITDELVMSYSLQACQKCHAGAKQPMLDTAAAVKANISQVLIEINDGTMPPPQEPIKLTACQKAIVKHWADGTAKNIGEIAECKSAPPPVITPALPIIPIELMPLNFETLKTKIIEPKCLFCHNPKGEDWEAALVSFETYADITTGEYSKYWDAPAIQSKVYDEITYHQETKTNGMPPNDSKTARVTKSEIDFIVRWIDAGKPEL